MYTIGQVSEMFHLPISTLRYYDKEGLLPDINDPAVGSMLCTKDHPCPLSYSFWISGGRRSGSMVPIRSSPPSAIAVS